ncbi:hypothetical protein ABPG72_017701 [Tetrahymena utriculariae]
MYFMIQFSSSAVFVLVFALIVMTQIRTQHAIHNHIIQGHGLFLKMDYLKIIILYKDQRKSQCVSQCQSGDSAQEFYQNCIQCQVQNCDICQFEDIQCKQCRQGWQLSENKIHCQKSECLSNNYSFYDPNQNQCTLNCPEYSDQNERKCSNLRKISQIEAVASRSKVQQRDIDYVLFFQEINEKPLDQPHYAQSTSQIIEYLFIDSNNLLILATQIENFYCLQKSTISHYISNKNSNQTTLNSSFVDQDRAYNMNGIQKILYSSDSNFMAIIFKSGFRVYHLDSQKQVFEKNLRQKIMNAEAVSQYIIIVFQTNLYYNYLIFDADKSQMFQSDMPVTNIYITLIKQQTPQILFVGSSNTIVVSTYFNSNSYVIFKRVSRQNYLLLSQKLIPGQVDCLQIMQSRQYNQILFSPPKTLLGSSIVKICKLTVFNLSTYKSQSINLPNIFLSCEQSFIANYGVQYYLFNYSNLKNSTISFPLSTTISRNYNNIYQIQNTSFVIISTALNVQFLFNIQNNMQATQNLLKASYENQLATVQSNQIVLYPSQSLIGQYVFSRTNVYLPDINMQLSFYQLTNQAEVIAIYFASAIFTYLSINEYLNISLSESKFQIKSNTTLIDSFISANQNREVLLQKRIDYKIQKINLTLIEDDSQLKCQAVIKSRNAILIRTTSQSQSYLYLFNYYNYSVNQLQFQDSSYFQSELGLQQLIAQNNYIIIFLQFSFTLIEVNDNSQYRTISYQKYTPQFSKYYNWQYIYYDSFANLMIQYSLLQQVFQVFDFNQNLTCWQFFSSSVQSYHAQKDRIQQVGQYIIAQSQKQYLVVFYIDNKQGLQNVTHIFQYNGSESNNVLDFNVIQNSNSYKLVIAISLSLQECISFNPINNNLTYQSLFRISLILESTKFSSLIQTSNNKL